MQDRREKDLLKQQVMDMMDEELQKEEHYSPKQNREMNYSQNNNQNHKQNQKKSKSAKKKKHYVLKISGMIAAILLGMILITLGTKPGRGIIYKAASDFVYSNVHNEDVIEAYEAEGNQHIVSLREEDYVTNYLIFGIEEFGGAKNTDSMMIASINTKDDTIKLTSLLRDSYVEIPGYKANKLNSAFSKGGARLLVDTIEINYKIKIDGYMSVDFKSFEKIVDLLGGVTIELGEKEANYLNTTNYISKKSNRNVKPGVNKLNGNQVMGYCRVRKVETLGGVNNDYGRIVRQQRALSAIFDSYKSPKNLMKIFSVTKECMSYATTNLTQSQIEQAMEAVVENKITTLETFRIPVDKKFDAPKKYNGIGYPLVLNWEANRIELYQFIFSDSKKEAEAELAKIEG